MGEPSVGMDRAAMPEQRPAGTGRRLGQWLRAAAPGLTVATAIAGAAWLAGAAQDRWLAHAVLEPLVLALLGGMALRLVVGLPARVERGAAFAAKGLLEFGIVLLGASFDLAAIGDAGARLGGAVVASVGVALGAGVALGRAAGLPPKLAVLVAVGNAICGNSAIAAVAPTIRAKKQDIAAAVALTAVLSVAVVLLLPLLAPLLGLTDYRYGVVAGLTVYAVPQVLAASFPVSAESGQVGTLVKLTRVLLLGPVVALFAVIYRGQRDAGAGLSVGRILPWFLAGFALCALARTAGVVPDAAGDAAKEASRVLTIVAMAGLGLGVDPRGVRAVGPRVAAVVVALTLLLVALALVLTAVLGLDGLPSLERPPG